MKSCMNCQKFKTSKTNIGIQRIKDEYSSSNEDWFMGFSGGKDSTALLSLVIQSVEKFQLKEKTIRVIYCNTGVEIPTISRHTLKKINMIRSYCHSRNLPIKFHIAFPKIKDRFFVKVIGRGYATPTNKFRWCTDRLRIKPVDSVIRKFSTRNALVLLGIRSGESSERDKIIANYHSEAFRLLQSGKSDRYIFAPILDFSTEDVWGVISSSQEIFGDLGEDLIKLYKNASGECPTVRDPRSPPCGKGRFGCWTCTVVRKDKSVTKLVESSNPELKPLLDFRNWLAEARDNKVYREKKRRNGAKGPGPFTLAARKEILKRLLLAQKLSKLTLISKLEIKEIKKYWALDTKK